MRNLTSAGLPLQILWEDESYFALSKPALCHSVSLSHSELSHPNSDSLTTELAAPPSARVTVDIERTPHLKEGAVTPPSAPSHSGPSVADLLRHSCPYLKEVGITQEDAGLLQRLDFETSGIVLGAKYRDAWVAGRALFKSGLVAKKYRVLLEGVLAHDQEIDAPIGSPYRRGSKVRAYLPGKSSRGIRRARPAKSSFQRVMSDDSSGFTVALVRTSTGRRHQVRAHAAALSIPLWGDAVYGSTKKLSELLSVSGEHESQPPFLLHAEQVTFIQPFTHERVDLLDPAPRLFQRLAGL